MVSRGDGFVVGDGNPGDNIDWDQKTPRACLASQDDRRLHAPSGGAPSSHQDPSGRRATTSARSSSLSARLIEGR